MNKDSITKQQLWLLLGAYINHVEKSGGIDFLARHYAPNIILSTQDILLLQEAKKELP